MQRLTADQFLIGLLAALAVMSYKTIIVEDTRFDVSMEQAFHELERIAVAERLDLLFRIRTDSVRGDSLTARQALMSAAQRQAVSLSSGGLQEAEIKLTPAEARDILDALPGGPRLFGRLGNVFLEHYETVAA